MKIKFLFGDKDGGPHSKVKVWGIEHKGIGSILLLKFDEGSREAFHSHAFSAISWVLYGSLQEKFLDGRQRGYRASFYPVITPKNRFHKVKGLLKANWVFTIRGRWADTWQEVNAEGLQTLAHGRKVVTTDKARTS